MGSAIGGRGPALIVSEISAVLQTAQTWIAYRDSNRAGEVFRSAMRSGASDPFLSQAANQLSMVPARVLNAMGMRVEVCWTHYEEMLIAPPGSFMSHELDDATEAVKRCVCRELKRLKSLNGLLPPGKFTQWWVHYGYN